MFSVAEPAPSNVTASRSKFGEFFLVILHNGLIILMLTGCLTVCLCECKDYKARRLQTYDLMGLYKFDYYYHYYYYAREN